MGVLFFASSSLLEQWPNAAELDDMDNLGKQPWFVQEILRAMDEWGVELPPVLSQLV